MAGKVLITKKQALGEEEYFWEWFECPACSCKHVAIYFKFCPGCGASIEFTAEVLREVQKAGKLS